MPTYETINGIEIKKEGGRIVYVRDGGRWSVVGGGVISNGKVIRKGTKGIVVGINRPGDDGRISDYIDVQWSTHPIPMRTKFSDFL